MTYLTGDTHGNFLRVDAFCRTMGTGKLDTLIILGDAGFNYHLNDRDTRAKEYASALPITFFCVHGNHEARPRRIPSYVEGEYHGGKVLYEEAFPNILFAVDGEIYDFDGRRCVVIGGAYSVDKHYRLAHGLHWWPDEQPDEEIKAAVEQRLAALNWSVDVVLSHTCPRKYEPTEVFLSGFDQSAVDKSTEDWLDGIENRLDYRKWYCGHYHTRKQIDKMQFIYEDFDTLFIRFDLTNRKTVVLPEYDPQKRDLPKRGDYVGALSWLKAVCECIGGSFVFALDEALMCQGSFGGRSDEFIIWGYGDDSASRFNGVALLGNQISHDDVEEKDGLLYTGFNRTIMDALANEAILDMQGITEALSKYYYTHGNSFDGIFVATEYRERFAELADNAVGYYAN